MRKYFHIFMVLGLSACAQTQFGSNNNADGKDQTPPNTVTGNDVQTGQVGTQIPPGGSLPGYLADTANFSVQFQTPQLDVILFVDTSGAINPTDAQKIRQKLASFVARLKAKTNLQVALIAQDTQANFGAGIDASVLGNEVPVKQVNTPSLSKICIAQLNLAAAVAVGCSAADNFRSPLSGGGETVTLCKVPGTAPAAYSTDELVEELSGKLSGFLRPQAKRAYIFISKDDPYTFKQQEFLAAAKASNGGVSPFVFAFTKKENTTFAALASATGGLPPFDLNNADWNADFDNIATRLLTVAGGSYVTPHPIAQMSGPFTIDGASVEAKCFSTQGNIIYVSTECVPQKLNTPIAVQATYQYTK